MKQLLLFFSLLFLLQLKSFSQCTANAGPDVTACANSASSITLNGTVSGGATGGTWTSSGTGTFSPDATTLTANYVPSAADITAGGVTLTLTTSGCGPVTDDIVITITPSPTVNAGADQTICAASNVALNGMVTIATGGSWSTSGTGAFSPNASTLNAIYIPSAVDQTVGNVTLTLTTTGNGLCLSVSDQVTINILPAPQVNAGPDQTICEHPGIATMNATMTNATTGVWTVTAGAGATIANPSTINTTVYFAAAGTYTLQLTAAGSGQCNSSDLVNITVLPSPMADAGPSQTNICFSSTGASLSGTVTQATGGTWTTDGTGTFTPNATTLNASYTTSAADKVRGFAVLYLTTTGNGSCTSNYDSTVIYITPDPAVNAGLDMTLCAGSTINLNGSITGASGGVWTSTGTGNFVPNPNTLNANYTPSAVDNSNGSVTFTLTSTGNGTCNAVSDQVTITFSPAPTANAGVDMTICGNSTAILSGTITNASGAKWTTSGTGTFNNSNLANAIYTPSTTDQVAGSVILTLTTTGNGSCIASSDNLTLTITNIPVVNAGPNQSLSAGGVTLAGTVTGATGGNWSSTGSGSFAPNNNTLSVTYTPSAADLSAGSVKLTLTSTGNGSCLAVSDQVVLTTNAQVCNVTITTTATGNSINFRATNNDGTSLGSYVWNFGDGTTAIGIVQDHVYATAGSYNASVYYTTENSSCSVTEYQMITIATVVIPTYSLSGTVKAGANNLDKGVVSLFKLVNANYNLLQTQTIGTGDNGSFSFSNLDNGMYILQSSVDPASAYTNSYSPTYFGNTGDWSTATSLVINNNNLSSQVIDLINYVSADVTWNTGTDTLSGTITFDASQPLRVSVFSVNPAAYAIVNLYNSNNVLLTSTVTDDFGYYQFPDLIGGAYTIKVDYAGGTSSNITTVLDGNPATDEKANTQVIKQSIATGLSQTQFISVAGAKMYPNPASAELNIELPSEANGASTISIYNAMGQLQYKEERNIISGNNISLNVQSLAPGLHIVEVMNGNKIYKGKLSKN